MKIISTRGIVVSTTPFKETSKIINIFTEDMGVIGCISKGCKSLKSKLRLPSEKFAYGTFHLYYNEKGLSTGEKKMLNNAKQILVSELVLAEHANQEEIEEQIENKINTSFMTFRAEGVEQQSIVNKFIPFDSDNGTTNA